MRDQLTSGIEVEILTVLIAKLNASEITSVSWEFSKNAVLRLRFRATEHDSSWRHLHLVDHSQVLAGSLGK